jgi:hypothetical protein
VLGWIDHRQKPKATMGCSSTSDNMLGTATFVPLRLNQPSAQH